LIFQLVELVVFLKFATAPGRFSFLLEISLNIGSVAEGRICPRRCAEKPPFAKRAVLTREEFRAFRERKVQQMSWNMLATTLGRASWLAPGRLRIGLVVSAIFLLSACSIFDRRLAVPPADTHDATVLGLPNARFFVDRPAAISAEQEH
jgi:hypothetical protein